MPHSHDSPSSAPSPGIVEGKEVQSARGAVATGPPAAALIGARTLARGGNAMDAAAAASLACAVLEPESVDLGGYVFCGLVREAASGKVWSVDSNAVAPRAARPRMFRVLPLEPGRAGINESEYDCSVAQDANIYGPLSIAVPGFVAGVGTLWERWGRLRWPEIVAPSERLVADGFPYGPTAAAIARRLNVVRTFDAAFRHLMPDGKLPAASDLWHRPGLGTTLARLSAHGWRDFYSGELGRRIAGCVQELGGLLTAGDMADFSPRVGPALEITYRGRKVFGPPLPGGALTTLQILKMLECFPSSVEDRTSAYWHPLAEIMKLAWQDRLQSLGDPDFTEVPVERLLANSYAQSSTEHLRRFPESVGTPDPRPALPSPPGTIHVSAADAEGNVVSATLSQGLPFGSCVAVPGTGVILGHGMARFDPRPGLPNSVAGSKRPVNNIAPLIVSLADREIALGTRGGRPIVNVCAQLAHRIVDGGGGLREILSAPRLHVSNREPVEFLEFAFTRRVSGKILGELEAMGHRLRRKPELVEGAGAAHVAEFLTPAKTVRAAGNTWAAGVG